MNKFYTMFASFWDDVDMAQSESTSQLDPSWPVGLTFCFSSPCGERWFWMALGPIDKKNF